VCVQSCVVILIVNLNLEYCLNAVFCGDAKCKTVPNTMHYNCSRVGDRRGFEAVANNAKGPTYTSTHLGTTIKC
jgi:hypothetical protein